MKERILVWILVLTCFCGELAIHYMVYQDVRREFLFFTVMNDLRFS
ncbi:hypothetical protein RD136_004152 [Salmonella enterica]|nr:hypothetical protein [Salmonella enterica subsp. enterica serovar Oranienburg]EDS1171976.1 hypothetical protein [Salmonella enterica subsp. enterica serovar Gaminara]EEI9138638.1 hypothetical protein [Salmonella enterica subsp. enterica serovar Saintpaul]EEU7751294.1 hypothetical protein [Salmonella enterica]EDU1904690.1 hypothetical protein [Salmonella enterica subsp. enterica serovar Oranienburg]